MAVTTRSTSISHVSKPMITGPSPLAIIRKDPRDSVKLFFESVKFIPENVKIFLFVANKSISYFCSELTVRRS